MASGQITMDVSSVDYGGGRGAIKAGIVFNWSVNDSGVLSVSYSHTNRIAGGNLWCVCATNGYTVDVDYSADGSNWSNILHSHAAIWPSCDTCYSGKSNEIDSIARYLSDRLGTVQLTQSGYVRMRMWTPVAAPTPTYPNAFPDDAASQATQVPVHIDVSWDAKLRYNANGGSNAPAGETVKESGASHTFTVSSQQPTRKHFDFKGWSTSAGGSATIHGGDRVTVTKDNPRLELYAVWEYNYRPGQIRVNGVWKSCDRDANLVDGKYTTMLGRCHIRKNGSWVEMRTRANQTGTEHAPVIRRNGSWVSMALIGDEGAPHDVSY